MGTQVEQAPECDVRGAVGLELDGEVGSCHLPKTRRTESSASRYPYSGICEYAQKPLYG